MNVLEWFFEIEGVERPRWPPPLGSRARISNLQGQDQQERDRSEYGGYELEGARASTDWGPTSFQAATKPKGTPLATHKILRYSHVLAGSFHTAISLSTASFTSALGL